MKKISSLTQASALMKFTSIKKWIEEEEKEETRARRA